MNAPRLRSQLRDSCACGWIALNPVAPDLVMQACAVWNRGFSRILLIELMTIVAFGFALDVLDAGDLVTVTTGKRLGNSTTAA